MSGFWDDSRPEDPLHFDDWWDDLAASMARHPSAPRCKCSHAQSAHYRDRKGRPTCGSAACGCTEFRAKETQ